MAPRPHNSGHYTLDACVTSQFEQQLRMVCGLPAGSCRLHGPVAMLNLLGDLWPQNGIPAWDEILELGQAKLHLYGKTEARPRFSPWGGGARLGATPEEAITLLEKVRSILS